MELKVVGRREHILGEHGRVTGVVEEPSHVARVVAERGQRSRSEISSFIQWNLDIINVTVTTRAASYNRSSLYAGSKRN